MQTIEDLNSQFGRGTMIRFRTGQGGLTVADLTDTQGSTTVALHGGHVLDYTPRDQRPVLWLSKEAEFAPGKAIRGGIPVCWPWFGPHPRNTQLQSHGFARNALWEVVAASGNGPLSVTLELRDSDTTRALWPHPFVLSIQVELAETLTVALTARNTGDTPIKCSAALHSYFAISDISDIQVTGLEGVRFRDQLDSDRIKVEHGPVRFEAETDRVYHDTSSDCIVEDSSWGRTVRVAKSGSHSAVVWNPWIAKASRMHDFGEQEFRNMVCVETTNADADIIHILPGQCHTLTAILRAAAVS